MNHRDSDNGHEDKPCKTAPGENREIIFNKDGCLAAESRFLWDYNQGLLTIDGRLAASGYVSSGSQMEGAYFAPMALGTGSFQFTPPSGYGGIVYRGGAIFYYWNDLYNEWEPIDFAAVDVIDFAHNGTVVGTKSTLNFVDSPTVIWTLTTNGSADITASADAIYVWYSNVNANGYGIDNLSSINGIPIGNFLTTTWNQSVNANGNDLYNVGNLSVNGQITYQGLPLGDWLLANELWSLSVDGSIYRSSNVAIYGFQQPFSWGPLTTFSNNGTNYLYLDVNGVNSQGGQWAALGVMFNEVYGGELGFSNDGTIELWNTDYLAFRVLPTGNMYFPGYITTGSVNGPDTIDIQAFMEGNWAVFNFGLNNYWNNGNFLQRHAGYPGFSIAASSNYISGNGGISIDFVSAGTGNDVALFNAGVEAGSPFVMLSAAGDPNPVDPLVVNPGQWYTWTNANNVLYIRMRGNDGVFRQAVLNLA